MAFTRIYRVPQVKWHLLWLTLFSLAAMPAQAESDPWRGVNKAVFGFNDFFDVILVRPVARTYSTFVPALAKNGIDNFFSNLGDINVMANNVMQLKFEDALSDSGRLLINTTIGVAGLIDVASGWGLQKHQEDFGQTLGYWNVAPGPYVVLPLFGPSTARDSVGFVVDTLLNPFMYHEEDSIRTALFAMDEVNTRANLLIYEDLVVGDPYLFYREAYLQTREFEVKDGNVDLDDEFGGF